MIHVHHRLPAVWFVLFADCNISPSTAASHDDELGRKLWELSEQMIAAANLGR